MKNNLENNLQINENDLEKSRKDIEKVGLILHFAGELVGPLYAMIRGIVPYLKHHEINYKNILIGTGIYVFTQIPAFFLKGLSQNKEDNIGLAEQFEEEKRQAPGFLHGLTQAIINMYYHFANHSERYDKWVYNYTKIRKKLFDNLNIAKKQNPKNI